MARADAFKRTIQDTRKSEPGGARLTVLLADDDASLVKAIGRDLVRRGYDVTTVLNGPAALEALFASSFDVIVSDIHMPGMSGVDLMRAIRTYDLDVPVILMTAVPELETAMQAVELGALQYLEKPVTRDKLVRAVERAARLHRLAIYRREAAREIGKEHALAADRAGLMHQLDEALESAWIAFQPIVDANGSIAGYEALLRSDSLSLATPAGIFSAATKLGRSMEVGRRARNLAAIEFERGAPSDVALFVNVTPEELDDDHLLDPVAPLSRVAQRVVLEVSERASLDDIQDLEARARGLRDLGFRIGLDDLGGGVAGMSGFVALEPEIVKLDGSLIAGLAHAEGKKRLVGAMTIVCKEMGARVVAEGVETRVDKDAADALGCEFFQGYFFAHPGRGFCEGPLAGEDVL